MRLALAALTVLVMGCAITGIGTGEAPADRASAPPAAAVASAKPRIAAGGAGVARGRALFEDEGCENCHSIAAVGADGKLGPRLDRVDDDADDIAESIVEPREDTVDGFPEKLMPDDFGTRLGDAQVADLAAFVVAAQAGEAEGGEGGEVKRPGGEDGGESPKGGGRGGGGDSGSGGGDSSTAFQGY